MKSNIVTIIASLGLVVLSACSSNKATNNDIDSGSASSSSTFDEKSSTSLRQVESGAQLVRGGLIDDSAFEYMTEFPVSGGKLSSRMNIRASIYAVDQTGYDGWINYAAAADTVNGSLRVQDGVRDKGRNRVLGFINKAISELKLTKVGQQLTVEQARAICQAVFKKLVNYNDKFISHIGYPIQASGKSMTSFSCSLINMSQTPAMTYFNELVFFTTGIPYSSYSCAGRPLMQQGDNARTSSVACADADYKGTDKEVRVTKKAAPHFKEMIDAQLLIFNN